MRAALVIGCALLLLLGSVAAGGAVAQQSGESADPAPSFVYEVDVHENGDATWELRAEFPIVNESDEAAFDELATEFEDDEGETYLPVEPYEVAVAVIESDLERSMAIVGEERTVNRTEGTGTLTVRFQWSGFAAVDGQEVQVGDAFDVGDQTWFSRLAADERLEIHGPQNFTVEDSGLPVRDRTMTIGGPAELAPADLQGTFVRTDPTDGGWLIPARHVAGMMILVLALIVGSYAYLRRDALPAMAQHSRSASDAVDPGDGDEEVDTAEAEASVDETLLSDEERILGLIEDRDGRMKQADIVGETDWSNAKVSQLLTQMEEDETIEKLRIGRENLIRLPDSEE